jgi:preprotein translocase subunit SecG
MVTFLLILTIIASILLIISVFVQNPKGGGIASDFGSSSQLGGVQRSTDLIEKITWGLGAVVVVLAITLSSMMVQPQDKIDADRKEAEKQQKKDLETQKQGNQGKQGNTKK